MKFYYVYVLKSLNRDFIYIGYTEDLRKRVLEHNLGQNGSTKPHIPFEIVHYEAYRKMADAGYQPEEP